MKQYNNGGDQTTQGQVKLKRCPCEQILDTSVFLYGGVSCRGTELKPLPGNWEKGSLAGMEVFPLLGIVLRNEEQHSQRRNYIGKQFARSVCPCGDGQNYRVFT